MTLHMLCRYSTDEKEIFSYAMNGSYIAAGCKGELFLWDRHLSERLALFDDIHAEDVVQVGHCRANAQLW